MEHNVGCQGYTQLWCIVIADDANHVNDIAFLDAC